MLNSFFTQGTNVERTAPEVHGLFEEIGETWSRGLARTSRGSCPS